MPTSLKAPILVLLPGMDGSGTLFAGLLAALGDRVRPLVISYPAGQQLGYAALADLVRPQLPTSRRYCSDSVPRIICAVRWQRHLCRRQRR